jgi:hypothetical protein
LEERTRKSGNHLGLARRLAQLGEYRRAQFALLEAPPAIREIAARGMGLEDLVAIEEGRFGDVIARRSTETDSKPTERVGLARAYVLAGNPEAALELTREPNAARDPRMRETAAMAHQIQGDISQAIDELEAAYVMGAPGSARVLGLLGRRLLEIGDPVEARVVLTRSVLSADFLEPQVVDDLSEALTHLGREAEAQSVRDAVASR